MNANIPQQTESQRKALRSATQSAAVRDIAIARGGTGELRREWTKSDAQQAKGKRKQAQASRKMNRRGA
ncbi:hypothetical protein [Salibacterium lacus]|uniref:Small EDRK-rich factor-like N-terminal domain-containing protein n=1 Tax=Salibacterium lacus TaxID=1898109 RepID=A0ABW5SY34_9BACI